MSHCSLVAQGAVSHNAVWVPKLLQYGHIGWREASLVQYWNGFSNYTALRLTGPWVTRSASVFSLDTKIWGDLRWWTQGNYSLWDQSKLFLGRDQSLRWIYWLPIALELLYKVTLYSGLQGNYCDSAGTSDPLFRMYHTITKNTVALAGLVRDLCIPISSPFEASNGLVRMVYTEIKPTEALEGLFRDLHLDPAYWGSSGLIQSSTLQPNPFVPQHHGRFDEV